MTKPSRYPPYDLGPRDPFPFYETHIYGERLTRDQIDVMTRDGYDGTKVSATIEILFTACILFVMIGLDDVRWLEYVFSIIAAGCMIMNLFATGVIHSQVCGETDAKPSDFLHMGNPALDWPFGSLAMFSTILSFIAVVVSVGAALVMGWVFVAIALVVAYVTDLYATRLRGELTLYLLSDEMEVRGK